MVTPGLHPAVPTLLAEASGNPPLMRQTCVGRRNLFQLEPCGSRMTSVIGTHGWRPGFHCITSFDASIFTIASVRQALKRRSGPQLLAHWLQADDLPDPGLADSDQGLAFNRALRHAVGQHRERVEPPESVNMT